MLAAVSSPVFEMMPSRCPRSLSALRTLRTNGKTSSDSSLRGGGEKTGVPRTSPMSVKTTREPSSGPVATGMGASETAGRAA